MEDPTLSQSRDADEPRPTPRYSVGGGASLLLASRLVVAAAGWAGSVVIARQLSTGAWGAYSFIFGLLGIIGLLVDLQVGRIVLRQILDAGEGAGRVVGSYVTFRFVVAVVAYATAAIFVVTGGYPPEVVRGTLVAGLAFLFAATGNGVTIWFNVRLWFRPGAVAAVLAAATQLALVFSLATGDAGTVVTFAGVAVVGDAVILGWRMWALHRYGLRVRMTFDPPMWWTWMRESIPLAIGFGLVTLYYKVDIVMLGQLDTLTSVGQYGIGYKFADVVSFVPEALMTPVMTLMVSAWPHDRAAIRRHFRQSFLLLFIAAVAVSVGFALAAGSAIEALYGARYAPSADAARFLVAGATLQFFSYLCFITLISVGRNIPYTVAGIVGLVLNVAFNLVLIPPYSFNGSAVATVLTEVIVLGLLLVLTARAADVVSVPWAAMARTGVAGAAMAGAYLLAVQLVPWAGAAAVGGLAFLGVLHLLGAEGPGGLPALWRSARFEQDVPPAAAPPPL